MDQKRNTVGAGLGSVLKQSFNRATARVTPLFFIFIFVLGFFLWMFSANLNPVKASPSNKVHIIQLNDDTINPVTADYIVGSIDRAVEENAQCLIIKLDTPGGLLNSTRLIVKKMLTSKVPIVVYIAPGGSRAGSAGVFITYASHLAAMAPSTNIGAAHPVQMGPGQAPRRKLERWDELKELIDELRKGRVEGEETENQEAESQEVERQEVENQEAEKEEGDVQGVEEIEPDASPMESKILNDTVAFIKSIAKERGRNVEWAVQSVVKSDSITNDEALEKGVIEIIAKNENDLLEKLDGRVININGQDITLETKKSYVEHIAMDFSQKFFNILANPNIAYFLMILGFYGLLFEVTHPGIGVPGILGAIFLILAFYSMQTLPTNYAGLALIILGLILLIAEAYTPTFGMLTLGGLVCLILGSMLLFDTVDPIMRVSKSSIFAFSLTTAGLTLFLVRSVIRSHRSRILGGKEGLVGEIGEVQKMISPSQKGKVYVHGELWTACSDQDIKKGEEVEVVSVQGLMIKVKKRE